MTGSHASPKPLLTVRAGKTVGLSQSGPTSGAGKWDGGHFHPNHMTECGTAGDPQRNGAAVGEMGKMEAGRAVNRCPIIERASCFILIL